MKNLTELGYSCTTFTERVLMRNVKEKMCYFPVVLVARLLVTSISGPADCVVLCDALRFLLWTLRYPLHGLRSSFIVSENVFCGFVL